MPSHVGRNWLEQTLSHKKRCDKLLLSLASSVGIDGWYRCLNPNHLESNLKRRELLFGSLPTLIKIGSKSNHVIGQWRLRPVEYQCPELNLLS